MPPPLVDHKAFDVIRYSFDLMYPYVLYNYVLFHGV
jgi:hypothetical protein